MNASYHRQDIHDKVWKLLEPHLPGQRGQWGGIAQDNRRWVLRTRVPWRDSPCDYGKWGSVHQRFIRWRRKGISAEVLLADRGYDTNEILAYAVSVGVQTVIPPKKSRKEQRQYDKYLYKLRHLVENCFLVLKRWRGIATRYAKTSDAFIAAVQIRCIAIWAAIRA